jgi:trimethylamine:corrinoid methyltransferase-like protein
MARRSVNSKDILARKNKTASRTKETRLVGTKKTANSPTAIRVVSMANNLVSTMQIRQPQTTDIKDVSLDVLSGIGISIREDVDREYSLLDEQTNENLLENLNIINPNLKNLTNTLQTPKDKFVNETNDPFYELDEGAPEYKKNQKTILQSQNKKDLSQIAADIYKINVSPGYPDVKKLKQFSK